MKEIILWIAANIDNGMDFDQFGGRSQFCNEHLAVHLINSIHKVPLLKNAIAASSSQHSSGISIYSSKSSSTVPRFLSAERRVYSLCDFASSCNMSAGVFGFSANPQSIK